MNPNKTIAPDFTNSYKVRDYAYAIVVSGQKRVEDSVKASSMDDAVKSIVETNCLSVVFGATFFRPGDGSSVTPVEWRYKGETALVSVWAPAGQFA